jgi:hypothetical protein
MARHDHLQIYKKAFDLSDRLKMGSLEIKIAQYEKAVA